MIYVQCGFGYQIIILGVFRCLCYPLKFISGITSIPVGNKVHSQVTSHKKICTDKFSINYLPRDTADKIIAVSAFEATRNSIVNYNMF